MAEPTTTRQNIRRAIGRAAHLEFFLRYGAGEVALTSAGDTTTVTLTSTALSQDTDFWQGAWVYDVEADAERWIVNSSSNGQIDMEFAQAEASTSGDMIEIWDMWPPSMIHDAINKAHRVSWRPFPSIQLVESLVLCEDKRRYGIRASDFNGMDTDDDYPEVGEVLQIWLETSRNKVTGIFSDTADSDGSAITNGARDTTLGTNSVNVSTGSDTDLDSDDGYLISFYKGTGAGQIRELTSISSDKVISWDTDLVTAVDTTTYYAIWCPAVGEQYDDWHPVTAVRFDRMENPSEMWLREAYYSAHGMRIAVKYVPQTSDFAADSDVTTVPEEFLVHKSLARLFAGLVSDNRVDRQSMAGLASYHDDLGEKFLADHGRDWPSAWLWSESDPVKYGPYSNTPNPLDW